MVRGPWPGIIQPSPLESSPAVQSITAPATVQSPFSAKPLSFLLHCSIYFSGGLSSKQSPITGYWQCSAGKEEVLPPRAHICFIFFIFCCKQQRRNWFIILSVDAFPVFSFHLLSCSVVGALGYAIVTQWRWPTCSIDPEFNS